LIKDLFDPIVLEYVYCATG